jgi:hypothetical protein
VHHGAVSRLHTGTLRELRQRKPVEAREHAFDRCVLLRREYLRGSA